jgi:high-affinity nickel-transport protein
MNPASPLAAPSLKTADMPRLRLLSLFDDAAGNLRNKVIGIYILLFLFNAGAWLWAVIAFRHYPLLLGTALLAYSFGLRHAVDADHIAAIDNVTRKLMQEGKRPIAVGLMFSLGHSTIVVIGSVLIAAAALALQHRMDAARDIGGLIGTLVSSLFLFAIAIVNIVVLVSIYRAFARVRAGQPYVDEDFDLLLANRGFLARLFKPMFALIRRSWHMYPLGVLFGLGFDTATEIGLLGAYGWAFIKPVRKLYYNLTITFVSVVVALVVGGIEALGLLAGQLHLGGSFFAAILKLNSSFGTLGYLIVGLFALSWIVSIAIYKWRRLDDLEF